MHSLTVFGSLFFFFSGLDPVVTLLISQSPIAPWEEPSRSQQTRLTHNHIISISSTTWPTDHRDQSLALDENALSAPSDKHAVWKKAMFLISNSGVICGPLGWGIVWFYFSQFDKMRLLIVCFCIGKGQSIAFSVIIIYVIISEKSSLYILIYNLILMESV